MDNDQSQGCAVLESATNSICSASSIKPKESLGDAISIEVNNKDVEVNRNAVTNCKNSSDAAVGESACDVPVSLQQNDNKILVEDKPADSLVTYTKSTDDDSKAVAKPTVTDSVANSLDKDDDSSKNCSDSTPSSLLRVKTSILNNDEVDSALESNREDSDPSEKASKSDTLVAESQPVSVSSTQDESMDVDESQPVVANQDGDNNDESASKDQDGDNNDESASKDPSSARLVDDSAAESTNEKDSSLSNASASLNDGKATVEKNVDLDCEERTKETKSSLLDESSKDQEDSNLGVDETSTNLSESTSTKFAHHDCDQELSQDNDVQEQSAVDPFAQTGDSFKGCNNASFDDECMEVDDNDDDDDARDVQASEKGKEKESEEQKEVVGANKSEDNCGANAKSVDEDEKMEVDGPSAANKEKPKSGENEKKTDLEGESQEKAVVDGSEKVKDISSYEQSDKSIVVVEETSEKDVTPNDSSVSKEGEEKTSDKSLSEEKTADESLSEEKTADESLLKEKTADVSLSEEKRADESLLEEKTADESLLEEKTADESLSGEKKDNVDGKAREEKDGEENKVEEVSEEKKDEEKSKADGVVEKVGEEKSVGEKDVVESSPSSSENAAEVSADKADETAKTSSPAEGDASEKSNADSTETSSKKADVAATNIEVSSSAVTAAKDRTNEVETLEIEIDEDICIIPDTVRLPPSLTGGDQLTKAGGKTPAKVLNEVKAVDNVKKELAEVKQEGSTSSRPKRQAATRADAQIKATVKEMELYIEEEEGEKENEDDEPNMQLCFQCNLVKPSKFNILNKNRVVSSLCSYQCANSYREAVRLEDLNKKDTEARRTTESGGGGTAPGNGDGGVGVLRGTGKTLNVHINEAGEFVRSCSQCHNKVTVGESMLSWETMDFCNEDCLGKYQNCLGSHCAYCTKAVHQTSLGKYCVRFGYDIRQFCSSSCLEEYKRGLKVCSFCQKDISRLETGFLAPVGDKGTFKDFCTQSCMEQYDQMSNNQPPPPQMHACDVCTNRKLVAVEVLIDSKLNKLCSDVCFAAFKFVNNSITVDQCDMCRKYFDRSTLRSDSLTVYYDDTQHNFCCKTCMNVYILAKRKIVPCNWCKVKKYNFDMIKRVLETGQSLMMCSLNCLTLYKVSINAVSSRRIKCDSCGSVSQAQYHLTMSDATIRNFCTYPCVVTFQAQYSKNPITLPGGQQPPIITGGPKRAIPPVSSKDTRTAPVPVISSVTSLATTNGQTPPNLLQSSPTVNSLSPGVTSSSKSLSVSPNSSTASSVPTASGPNNYVIVREKNPPKMMNKCTNFRPISHTKGVSCKPHACSVEVQTEGIGADDGKTVLIPVPVPIYIPTPMHMFSMPVPVPLPFPLPIPVPIFIPTTRQSAEGIMKEIKRIHEKIPTDPYEAELLMMAQRVADDKKSNRSASDNESGAASEGQASPERCDSPAPASISSKQEGDEKQASEDEMMIPVSCELTEVESGLDAELTPTTITASHSRLSSSIAISDNEEDVDDPQPVVEQPVRRKRGRPPLRGGGGGYTPVAKRGRRSSASTNHSSPLPQTQSPAAASTDKTDSVASLKFMLGVSAWKQWAIAKNAELSKEEAAGGGGAKKAKINLELLQLTVEELNYSLCLFVKEARKPNGDAYTADTIYYFCLGIQAFLFENGRIENIFTDAYFDSFTDALHQIAQSFPSAIDDSQVIVTRVEEEHLWESKQLGAHSPHVLLCTLMFFNTKYFNLVSVDDHMHLSFAHIMKQWRKSHNQPATSSVKPPGARTLLLRFFPPANNDSKKKKCYEQHENEDDPLRCPVKLYEFYLSKCPESVKTRSDVFYLQPERSCVPDSPVWYSTQTLDEEALSKVLNRVKMVKEVNVALVKS